VIEQMLPGDLDVSGWELKKALRLFRKSNSPLLEWLSSPIVYREDADFMGKLRGLMVECYSPGSCFRHYLHMAEGNVRGYLAGDTVRTKKYLYVLRPLLGCRWIEQERGPVPMEFEKLYTTLSPDGGDRGDGDDGGEVARAIRELVELKCSGAELEGGPRNALLSDFIEAELARLSALPFRREGLTPSEGLDRLFRETVSGR